jgi:ADP-heptose:LPS heptosyltransferase
MCYNYFASRGYSVIQLGEGESPDILGAIKMKTVTLSLLMYVLAGADLFIGIDSGIANIACALDKKMVVFHGNVNPEYIWPDMRKIRVITNHKNRKVCDKPYCWNEVVNGTEGQQCYINEGLPPCANFATTKVLDAINELL